MKPPPARLPASGHVTASENATATAASTALPPRFMTSAPTREARTSTEATMACLPRTGRRDSAKRGTATRRRRRLRTVIRIQRNIVVTEVRRQHHGAGRAAAEVDADRHALAGEDLRGVLFAVVGRLAVADERDRAGAQRDALDREARAAAADGGEDAAPVRVAAVQRGLDQRRGGDGVRGEPGIALGAGAAHDELHHARRAFAVADDHPGELAADVIERALEVGEVAAARAFAGGEEQHGVVRRCVAVDGDGVEALVDGILEAAAQRGRLDGGVGHHEAEHRGHVRMDHARALGHADDAPALAAHRERRLRDLRADVGGEDGVAQRIDASRREARDGVGQRVAELLVGERDADDAGGGDKDFVGAATEELRGTRAGALRGVHPRLAGDGVRAAGVDDDGLHAAAALLQRGLRQHDRRRLKFVFREDSGGARAVGRDDEAEVGALLADARADAGGEESFGQFHDVECGGHAAAVASRAAAWAPHSIRTRARAVPPIAFFRSRIDSSVIPCSCASSRIRPNSFPTISCASRNGVPFAAIASATAVAMSSGLSAAPRMRSRSSFSPATIAVSAGTTVARTLRTRKSGSLSSCRSLSYASGRPLSNARSPVSSPTARAAWPRVNSSTSGFFFCGMRDEPVAIASGSSTYEASSLLKKIKSSAMRERCESSIAATNKYSAANSRSETASSEWRVARAKPSERASASRSIGNGVPASAPEPSGHSSPRLTASRRRDRSRASISTR